MKVKQIFSTYEHNENDSMINLKFCPSCGEKSEIGIVGGKKRPICSKCGYVHYINPAPAVSVLIIKGDNFLLGKRAPGSIYDEKWCLPCGFIEFDEDFLTAGCREVMEETGLKISINAIISVCTNYLSPDLHSLVIVLLAEVLDGELKPGDDITELKWFEKSEALPEMAFEADIHIIERYYKTSIVGLEIDRDIQELSY